MECYNCGAELTKDFYCQNCGADVRIYKKIIQMSNKLYNDGLERAQIKDLSGAIVSLKKCLQFNKNHKEARNLLGLVYYEMGETVFALSEWVISKNLHPSKNIATGYINDIQKNPGRLEAVNLTIKKYNQALLYCKQNSCDLAVIQLKKVISLNPKLIKAYQLLALLYIKDGKYELARKQLKLAEKIDKTNLITQRYLKETAVKKEVMPEDKKKKKETQREEMFSFNRGNTSMIQPMKIKDTSAFGTILNLVIGIAIGMLIIGFLVVPSIIQNNKQNGKADLVNANDAISTKTQTITSLKNQINDLNTQLSTAQATANDSTSKIASYQQFIAAYSAYSGGDMNAAGTAMANVNRDYLDDASKTIYDTINQQISAAYTDSLYNDGKKAYNKGDYATATQDLQKVVDANAAYQDGDAVYFLAQAYRKNGDAANAQKYYQMMVTNYPDTNRAKSSQTYLNQLSGQ